LAYASRPEPPGMAGARSMRNMNLPTSVEERVKQCNSISSTPSHLSLFIRIVSSTELRIGEEVAGAFAASRVFHQA